MKRIACIFLDNVTTMMSQFFTTSYILILIGSQTTFKLQYQVMQLRLRPEKYKKSLDGSNLFSNKVMVKRLRNRKHCLQ